MAWSIGANDVATMACTVGSKILTLRMAIVIAAIFEASGAPASGQVTNMIRDGLIDLSPIHHQVDVFITGMFAALLSASTCCLWPHLVAGPFPPLTPSLALSLGLA